MCTNYDWLQFLEAFFEYDNTNRCWHALCYVIRVIITSHNFRSSLALHVLELQQRFPLKHRFEVVRSSTLPQNNARLWQANVKCSVVFGRAPLNTSEFQDKLFANDKKVREHKGNIESTIYLASRVPLRTLSGWLTTLEINSMLFVEGVTLNFISVNKEVGCILRPKPV